MPIFFVEQVQRFGKLFLFHSEFVVFELKPIDFLFFSLQLFVHLNSFFDLMLQLRKFLFQVFVFLGNCVFLTFDGPNLFVILTLQAFELSFYSSLNFMLEVISALGLRDVL